MSNLLFSKLGIVCPTCDSYNPPMSLTCRGCQKQLLPTRSKPASKPPVAAPRFNPPPLAAPPAAQSPQPQGNARFTLSVTAGPAMGQQFRLSGTGFLLGRSRGAVLFPDDPYVSPVHATFTVQQGKLFIRDDASASGVFIALKGPVSLGPLEQFTAGSRLFRVVVLEVPAAPTNGAPTFYGAPTVPGRRLLGVEEILTGGRLGRTVVTEKPIAILGKSPQSDIGFPEDVDLAPRHCELSLSPQGVLLKDSSGALGTFLRIPPGIDRPLAAGDRIRVGQEILTVEQ